MKAILDGFNATATLFNSLITSYYNRHKEVYAVSFVLHRTLPVMLPFSSVNVRVAK